MKKQHKTHKTVDLDLIFALINNAIAKDGLELVQSEVQTVEYLEYKKFYRLYRFGEVIAENFDIFEFVGILDSFRPDGTFNYKYFVTSARGVLIAMARIKDDFFEEDELMTFPLSGSLTRGEQSVEKSGFASCEECRACR